MDAMSSLGAIPLNLETACIDFLVTSSNKCLEGVPGFSIVLARRDALIATEGAARTLSLDLQAQWRGLETNGQFRFTPPTHTILALEQALQELEAEGGISARAARYQPTTPYSWKVCNGWDSVRISPPITRVISLPLSIILTIRTSHSRSFTSALNRRDFVIYPGKLTRADCFRIGNIGHIFPEDVTRLLAAIEYTLKEMGVRPRATVTESAA